MGTMRIGLHLCSTTHRCHRVVGLAVLRLVGNLDVRGGVLERNLMEHGAASLRVPPRDATASVAR